MPSDDIQDALASRFGSPSPEDRSRYAAMVQRAPSPGALMNEWAQLVGHAMLLDGEGGDDADRGLPNASLAEGARRLARGHAARIALEKSDGPTMAKIKTALLEVIAADGHERYRTRLATMIEAAIRADEAERGSGPGAATH